MGKSHHCFRVPFTSGNRSNSGLNSSYENIPLLFNRRFLVLFGFFLFLLRGCVSSPFLLLSQTRSTFYNWFGICILCLRYLWSFWVKGNILSLNLEYKGIIWNWHRNNYPRDSWKLHWKWRNSQEKG